MGKIRKKPISGETVRNGRRLAEKLCAEQVSWSKMIAQLITESGCSKSTAINWIRDARKHLLEEDAQIDTGDMESSRWGRLHVWDARSRRYRELADKQLKTKRGGSAPSIERIALKYEELIARACHWFELPPERDLADSEARVMVMGALKRQLHNFGPDELDDLQQSIVDAIESKSTPDVDDSSTSDQCDEVLGVAEIL